MDEAMAQLFAQRMGMTAEQVEALRGGNPSALLASQPSNPLMAALVSSMLMRKSESSEDLAESEEDRPLRDRELLRARRTIGQLKENLASADAMANHIADIFGACEYCWGLNKLCTRCGGRGRPGFTDPKQEELLGWLEPALQKLGLTVVKAG